MNYSALNTALLAVAIIPLVVGLVATLYRQAARSGREAEADQDVRRRLDRLERHAGFWGPPENEHWPGQK